MNNLTEIEKAYLAGLFDGEGCIGIDKTKSKSNNCEHDYKLRIIITNSNYPVICWVKEITGIGCTYKYDRAYRVNWKPVHRWQVVSRDAKDFINALMPYLIIKRDISEACLEFPNVGRGHHRSQDDYKEQEKHFAIIKGKNTRGIRI
jgi:hypothetical protein